jgi:hypothetical protein
MRSRVSIHRAETPTAPTGGPGYCPDPGKAPVQAIQPIRRRALFIGRGALL